jgi:hypothetical protein
MMNITVIFTVLLNFANEVESAIVSLSGVSMRCSLRSFIEDHVEQNFLGFVEDDLNEKLEAAIKGPDAQKTLADTAAMKGAGSQRPLLQTAVVLAQGLDQLRSLMEHMPPYASKFLEMAIVILATYRDSCNQLYRSTDPCGLFCGGRGTRAHTFFEDTEMLSFSSDVLGATEDGQLRIVSGMWARDEDIKRLLMLYLLSSGVTQRVIQTNFLLGLCLHGLL